MPQRSLTELLKTHHDKLDQHTAELHEIQTKLTSLEASVSRLEDEVFDEGKADDAKGGLRAGLRDWVANIRELM